MGWRWRGRLTRRGNRSGSGRGWSFSSHGVRPVIPLVAQHADRVEALCRHYGVQRLDLFGSASVQDDLPEDSDLDFVVEFQPEALVAYADAYFGLLEALEQLFGRRVDLVVDSAIRNPYFREAVDESRTRIYAA